MAGKSNGQSFRLSDEQKAAIDYRGGHLQIIACAGSGKTEAISRRVANLIVEGALPEQIIAFTFTDRAAASLKTRITQKVAELKGADYLDKLGPMFVGTIHAYCLRLLQDHVPEFGNHDILDENRLAGLLSREHKRLELSKLGSKHWAPIFEFLRNVEVVENELIDVERFRETNFGACYSAYRQSLDRYHFLTYGMLITCAIEALGRPQIHKKVHGRLRHLIVDEYQDINPAQERLIELLAQQPVNLCVVGDDDQAIYQWRGSDVNNILTFETRYKKTKRLPISINRRCRPKIVTAANDFAKTIAPRLDKKMGHSRTSDGPELHSWAGETDVEEAQTIASTIAQLHKRGYRYRDVAVLFRSVRTSSAPLIDALRAADIPFRCAGRTGLFMQPEASVIGKTYAWLTGNDWKNERFSHGQPVKLEDLLDEYDQVFALGGKTKELERYFEDWKSCVGDSSTPADLVRDYYRLLNLLGIQELDLDDEAQCAVVGCLGRFSEILADFEHVTRRARYVEENGQQVFKGGQDRGTYYYRRLYNYLQYYALDAYEDFTGEESFDLDAVDILTVHQAKGLEWPVVFVPSLVVGRFPSSRAGEVQDWLLSETVFPKVARRRYEGGDAEERRLFYVAMTRAKDMLYLSRFHRKKNRFKLSPFLLSVAGGEPPIEKKLPLPPPFTPSADGEDDRPRLSFSDLALYERCPKRYRLSSSLGFQPQLVRELGYGKSIHHMLRRIADETRARKRLLTAAEIETLFQTEFYLPFANRPAFEQLYSKAKQLVDRYLTDYKQDLSRVWETERPFELYLDQGVVNGRADVILDKERGKIGSLAIVDYKTAADAGTDDVFAFQLAIYAAAGRGEGLDVQAAYLHELATSTRKPIPVDEAAARKARQRAEKLIEGIVDQDFPANPDKDKCPRCDVRAVCGQAQCSKYDY